MTATRAAAPDAAAWLWAAAIALLLLAPVPAMFAPLADAPQSGLPLDKLVHVALFAALTRAWLRRRTSGSWRLAAPAIAAAAVAYGGLLELLQPIVSARTAQWGDLVADAAGAGLALALAGRHRGEPL